MLLIKMERNSLFLSQSLHARLRFAPYDFFENCAQLASVTFPGILSRGFRCFDTQPIAEFSVFVKTPNHCREFCRVLGIIKNHSIDTVRDYFRYSGRCGDDYRESTGHCLCWRSEEHT